MTTTTKTKFDNIFSYETKKGTFYRVRKTYIVNGEKIPINKSSFKKIVEAKGFLAQMDALYVNEEFSLTKAKKMTFDQLYQEFREFKIASKRWTAATTENNDSAYNTHYKEAFGNMPVQSLRRLSYQKFVNEKLKTLKQSSMESFHEYFTAMINYGVNEGYLKKNPLIGVNIQQDDYTPIDKHLETDEYIEWMNIATDILNLRDITLVYLAAYGMRRGEILGLRVGKIKWMDGYTSILIDETRTPLAKSKDTKNHESRTIIVGGQTTQLLHSLIKFINHLKKSENIIPNLNDHLFINPQTLTPVNTSHAKTVFDKVNKEFYRKNFKQIQVTPHMLRHNFSTQMHIAGVLGKDIQELMGHKKYTMTMDYTHSINESKLMALKQAEHRIEIKK